MSWLHILDVTRNKTRPVEMLIFITKKTILPNITLYTLELIEKHIKKITENSLLVVSTTKKLLN